MQKAVLRTKTLAEVCAIVAGALALFGSVSIFGVELPLATMPHATGAIANTLLQASESLGDFPAASGRLTQIISFLQSAADGPLSHVLLALSIAHITVCTTAIVLAGYDLIRGHRTWRCVLGGSLAAADALIVAVLCSTMSWRLYLVVRSVAQGNPWAVGRGVAGLDTTLSPGLGLTIAGVLGIAAIVLALLAHRGARPEGDAGR